MISFQKYLEEGWLKDKLMVRKFNKSHPDDTATGKLRHISMNHFVAYKEGGDEDARAYKHHSIRNAKNAGAVKFKGLPDALKPKNKNDNDPNFKAKQRLKALTAIRGGKKD